MVDNVLKVVVLIHPGLGVRAGFAYLKIWYENLTSLLWPLTSLFIKSPVGTHSNRYSIALYAVLQICQFQRQIKSVIMSSGGD